MGFRGTIRQSLGQLRLRSRLHFFGNNHSLKTNLLYQFYHRHAQSVWAASQESVPSEDLQLSRAFQKDGYLLQAPVLTSSQLTEIRQKVDALFEESSKVERLSPGVLRLRDGLESMPEIPAAFLGPIERIVEGFYQAHFKVYGVYFYRTLPHPNPPESSFLWHVDNVPRHEIKAMIYLDDTTDETGAFRCKGKPLSDRLKIEGWWDRASNHRFSARLDEPATTNIFEGPTGTCILFQNGACIHKATRPTKSHRDVVTFVIIPSDVPWHVHFARNRHKLSTNTGICLNPYRDTPQSIGYSE